MKVTIMQPAYLPWLGFFDRIDASDIFIVLDNVELDTNSKTKFTNRNKIRTKEGWIWLSLPLKIKGLYQQAKINQIQLIDDNWPTKHWKSINNLYNKARFFNDYNNFIEDIYNKKWSLMQDLLDYMLILFLKELNINTKILKASELKVDGFKGDLILNICKEVNASVYYSGVFGREYLDKNKFDQENIELLFHEYNHPVYPQVYQGFEPFMSIIDLLFNCGHESLDIIKQGRRMIS